MNENGYSTDFLKDAYIRIQTEHNRLPELPTATPDDKERDFNIEDYVVEKYFKGNKREHDERKKSGIVRYCKKYVKIAPAPYTHDFPTYFLLKSTGEQYGICAPCWGWVSKDQCKRNCPPDDLDCAGSCPTWECSILGDLEAAKRFIKEGQDVNTPLPDGFKEPPLMAAARAGREDFVELLIQSGANVNCQNASRNTALHVNIGERPSAKIVKMLIEAGADINIRMKTGNMTALQFARYRLNQSPSRYTPALEEIVEILEEHSNHRARP